MSASSNALIYKRLCFLRAPQSAARGLRNLLIHSDLGADAIANALFSNCLWMQMIKLVKIFSKKSAKKFGG